MDNLDNSPSGVTLEDMDSVMIDLETMGTGPNAAVVQIGAIPFNSQTGMVRPDFFLADVDLASSVRLGGLVTEDTRNWWLDQGGFKHDQHPEDLLGAMTRLGAWMSRFPNLQRVWAQGPSFDVAILEGYYQRAGLEAPWAFNAARDTRTVYDLARERGWDKPEGTEAKHHALEDCRRQIICLRGALAVLRGGPSVF